MESGTAKTKQLTAMYYDTNCTYVTPGEWHRLMKGARKCSYRRLVRRIKAELPDVYRELALQYYNPWEGQCRQTATHYVLVHSAIEHFIHK